MGGNKVVDLRSKEQLKTDKRLARMLWLMPENVRDSLTKQQLQSLKTAKAATGWQKYAIHMHTFASLFSFRYYSVLTAEREQRKVTSKKRHVQRLTYSLLFIVFFLPSALLGIILLYLLKSAIGIDIFPGFSFGVWSWFKEYV